MGNNSPAPQAPDQTTLDFTRLLFRHSIEIQHHTSLKNNKVIRYKGRRSAYSAARPFIATNPKYKSQHDLLVLSLQERARSVLLSRPIRSPVRIMWALFLDNFWTKSKPIRLNKKSGDISNLIQGPEDALVKAGIIEDDSLIIEMHVRKLPYHRNAISIEIYEANPL